MTEADIVGFGKQIMQGVGGQAPWRRPCVCGHFGREHDQFYRCKRPGCDCKDARAADHEALVVWLHPDAVHYLPPGVYVIEVGNVYEPIGEDGRGGTSYGVQFILGRDLSSDETTVVRGGVKKETTIWTSQPEGDT